MLMNGIYDTIQNLTAATSIDEDKSLLVQHFSRELGWSPSYNLFPSYEGNIVNMHLVVEHGLENSAIISFLKVPYNSLNQLQRNSLLNISYNNLVDWHIHIDRDKIIYVNNRSSQSENVIQEAVFRNEYYESLRSDAFEKIIGKKIRQNIPPLDDALINTISHWKRNISAELNNAVDNESLSSLFNSIIFVRALEDYLQRYSGLDNKGKILLEKLSEYQGQEIFTGIIENACTVLYNGDIPKFLLNKSELEIFNTLSRQTIFYLFSDFYTNRVAGFYNYDFSIMSKHALSRIYEKYIAILKIEDTNQLSIFP